MADKPTTAAGYKPEQVELVRAACLYVATILGDLIDDLVVIGGLVPSLLIDQTALDADGRHVGTIDLDVGLTLGMLDEGRYKALTERLRRARFAPDTNDDGNVTRQRWKVQGTVGSVTVDFLIPPSLEADRAGRLRNIEKDFAAIIAPGLRLAFRDRRKITLDGHTVFGERAKREVWSCGPGAFVSLKAHALRLRGENKDAYDLYYMVRNFGSGVEDVAASVRQLLDDPEATEALRFLSEDFATHDSIGPQRAAVFITGGSDDNIQADVLGFVQRLIAACKSG